MITGKQEMIIRRGSPSDREQAIPLIAEFRVTLAGFRGKQRTPNLEGANSEWEDYQRRNYHVFVAEEEERGKIVGYLVCRTEEDVVWAESIFVLPAYRSKGIGSTLYEEAERLAEERGGDTVYNWIHPNNDGIINFLQKRGYTVLNLIEVRRHRSGEETEGKIRVGDYDFDY